MDGSEQAASGAAERADELYEGGGADSDGVHSAAVWDRRIRDAVVLAGVDVGLVEDEGLAADDVAAALFSLLVSEAVHSFRRAAAAALALVSVGTAQSEIEDRLDAVASAWLRLVRLIVIQTRLVAAMQRSVLVPDWESIRQSIRAGLPL